jgi:hypothetical protein
MQTVKGALVGYPRTSRSYAKHLRALLALLIAVLAPC